jgi:hypothetical protein
MDEKIDYNGFMTELKQKYAIYFKKEEARRFADVFDRALSRNDRAEWSAVIKELMGFPLPPRRKPLITEEDREIIRLGIQATERKHGSGRPVNDLGVGRPRKKEA